MDEIARYNTARWKALAQANALFTRPWLDLEAASARERLDPEGRLGDVTGQHVLCLAGGGGKQSAAFALLGAHVTVLDLSEEQLQRDREAAAHYRVNITTMQGDMRDLSRLPAASFDIVWHPYSLNFVPEAPPVFREVARVLKPGGVYVVQCANPFTEGLSEQDWNGQGYTLKLPYQDGAEITYTDSPWVHVQGDSVPPPREYRHMLSTIINGLIAAGFTLRHVSDTTDFSHDPQAEPGSWEHFTSVAPPWLHFWSTKA